MTKFYTNIFQRGNNIYIRGFDKGLRFENVIPYKPYLFIEKKNGAYKTIHGNSVDKIKFDSIKSAKEFIETNKDVVNRKIYGLTNFAYLYIYDNYTDDIKYDASKISVVTIDIETSLYSDDGVKKFPNLELADHEIVSITLTKNNKSVTLSCLDYTSNDKNKFYVKCKNEEDLLDKFLQVWESPMWSPDIVTGWNTALFDNIMISNRIAKILGESHQKRLSPFKLMQEKKVILKGKEITYLSPRGISFLDYLDVYKKIVLTPRERYSLDYISQVELGEKKLDYSDYKNLDVLLKENPQLFIEYNIRDCLLVDRLENKLNLIKMIIDLAYTNKCNFEDILGTVKPWDMYIHHYLRKKNIVIPQKDENVEERDLVGGFVKEPIPNIYKYVVSYDVKSSYPHQIMTYNLSPETLVGKLNKEIPISELIEIGLGEYDSFVRKNNYSVSANCRLFSKEKTGFMAEIMEDMFAKRAEYQNILEKYEKLKEEENTNKYDNLIAQYDVWQHAKKISINAFYGMLANEYCRWYSIDLAEAITMSGQLTVKWIEYKLNKYLNKLCETNNVDYIVAGDTDSNYIFLEPLFNHYNIDMSDRKTASDYIEKFCKEKLDPYIKKSFEELHVRMNSYQQKIRMARENIADVSIWTAKKHYVMNVINSKGTYYEEPKLKMVGIDTVKSSTPAICKNALIDCIKFIVNNDKRSLQDYVEDFKIKFYSSTFEEIAFPRGVNGIMKYYSDSYLYIKGTPFHVKGAIQFNRLLKKHKIKDIPPISDGDKIKFCYLIMPNIIHDNVISVPDYLPEIFELEKYIDYKTQFEKTFIKPLSSLTDVVGWSIENRKTLEDY